MIFDKSAHIEKMKPHTDKLLNYLVKKGIEFTANDGLENVIFTSKAKKVTISHTVFYRFSGIAAIHKDKGDHEIEVVEVDDNMFMNSYMKSILDYNFR